MRLSQPDALLPKTRRSSDMTETGYDLDEAYQINGPADARKMYGAWQDYPRHLARHPDL